MEKRKDFYLIFKEAIHNCAKYAQAKQVEVAIKKENNALIMSIKDDGVGFDMDQTASGALGDLTTFKKLSNQVGGRRGLGGNGLRNMAARAAAIGGDLGVTSSAGAGTKICLTLSLSTSTSALKKQ